MDSLHACLLIVVFVCFAQISFAQNRDQECYELEGDGTITSVNYPLNYEDSHTECWILRSSGPGMNVQLTIHDLDVERCGRSCGCDAIKISSGDVSSLQNQQGCPLCGSSIPSEPITSTGDSMYVEFSTDGSATGSGFSATFTSVYGPADKLPCYRHPQVPLPAGDCGADELTSILQNIFHILRQDTLMQAFDSLAYEYSGAGIDLVSDEGVRQLACYISDVQSIDEVAPLFFTSAHDFQYGYHMVAPMIKNINMDGVRQGLLSIRKLVHWIRRTGLPTLPLRDTTYADTWAFFTELQSEHLDNVLLEITPLASMTLGGYDEIPMIQFFTASPEELARVMHDANNNDTALYELFSPHQYPSYYSPLYSLQMLTSEEYHFFDIVLEPMGVALFELESAIHQLGWWDF